MAKTHLLPGIFETSQQMGKSYLMHLEVDRLVAPCYEAIGLVSKAKRYGGWEAMAIAGHSLGHFLSAAAFMVQATGDKALQEKMDYAVDELAFLQSQEPSGYVSGFPRDCFDRVFSGNFEVDRFGLGGSWVPWYSIHKIFAGLIDVYRVTGSDKALEVVIKLANWAKKGTDNLDDAQFERMLYCEYGGMNEVMADLYEITGNEAYLMLAERFCHQELMEDLSQQKDNLEGKHANTQIPKILGAAKLYLLTGKEKYQTIASFFWEEVVNNRTYVIGGNSNAEHFGKTRSEPLGVATTETCNTYNMMKLSTYLFEMTSEAKYMDYYETAMYNHILASQDPDTGMKTYFMATEPGHFKTYCDPDNSFWCCTGSGMENPGRYHQQIYTQKDKTIYTNLYISSEYESEKQGLSLKQITAFPYEARSKIEIMSVGDRGAEITLALRVPSYLKQKMEVTINGNLIEGEVEKGYLNITKQWQTNDVIEIFLPMDITVYHAKDQDSIVSFLYGPIVLAAALGTDNFPESDIQENHTIFFGHPKIQVPVLVCEEAQLSTLVEMKEESSVESSVEPSVEPSEESSEESSEPKQAVVKSLCFKTRPVGQPGGVSFDLIPFFTLHHERYALYFRWMTQEKFEKVALTSPTYQENLDKITIDRVAPHQQQPEIDHQMMTEKSTSDYLPEAGSGWREAREGGFFSYQMAIDKEHPNYLCVTYWGNDCDVWYPEGTYTRSFDILVDGQLISSETLKAASPSMLYDIFYELPLEVTATKEKVWVTFQSKEKTLAGRVFNIRTTRECM